MEVGGRISFRPTSADGRAVHRACLSVVPHSPDCMPDRLDPESIPFRLGTPHAIVEGSPSRLGIRTVWILPLTRGGPPHKGPMDIVSRRQAGRVCLKVLNFATQVQSTSVRRYDVLAVGRRNNSGKSALS